ncbi:MAG: ABC transporter ATP-binding protein [Methanomicrobiales archaeon]|nr:ABC transporter ATP-binding protein [Methanomicrobiales archaeon]
MTDKQGAVRRLIRYLTRYSGKFWAATFLMALFAVFQAILPLIMGTATNDIVAGNMEGLERSVLLLLFFSILMFITGMLGQRIFAAVSQQALCDLRTELFDHMQSLSLNFFDRQPIGQLMSRVTSDIDVIDQFFSNAFQNVMQAVVSIVVITAFMLWLSVRLTILVYAVLVALSIFIWVVSRISKPAFSVLQEHISTLNGYAEEHIEGQKVVLAFMQEGRSVEEFSKVSRDAARAGGKASFTALITLPISITSTNLQSVLLLGIGGVIVVMGRFDLGLLVSFLGLSRGITGPLSHVFMSYSMLMNAIAGAGRVFAILDETPVVADRPGASAMPKVRGDVIFDHVDFAYIPGRTVLLDNSFHAAPGQVFGLCGPTGAGKSTIINILTRYYDIQSGSIAIDGTKIDSVQQDTLRIQIAQVLQEPFLFSDTIMENLRYARAEATDEECIAAAKQAGADGFIMAQPQGYQTFLADGGAGSLSQGQRQMLTIARAMVANPRLLILDEATSNVDTRTEKLIQAGLLQLQQGKTSFIIAHRLATIRHADTILVINKGQIIERGSHAQLMEKQGFYHSMYMSQFRGKLAGITKAA